jgi:hypothetical protein
MSLAFPKKVWPELVILLYPQPDSRGKLVALYRNVAIHPKVSQHETIDRDQEQR